MGRLNGGGADAPQHAGGHEITPDGEFVLRRSERYERRLLRVRKFVAGIHLAVLYAVIFWGVLAVAEDGLISSDVARAAVLWILLTILNNLDQRRIRFEQLMQGLELRIAPGGLVYACAAGSFDIPWPSVRGIRLTGSPLHWVDVRVDAASWSGPLSGARWKYPLRIPLDGNQVDIQALAAAVRRFSGGRFDLLAR